MRCTCTKFKCPVNGGCGKTSVVYQAVVKWEKGNTTTTTGSTNTNDNSTTTTTTRPNTWTPNPIEKYIGMTGGTFKARWNFHNSQCKHRHLSTTTLSNYIWKLKDHGFKYSITWKIISRANKYSTSTKSCNLCTKEKLYLIYRKEMCTLNSQDEIMRKCKHRRQNLISSVK